MTEWSTLSWHAMIRAHQIQQQVALEQESDRYERLYLSLTDHAAKAEALALSVELAARANRIRNALSLTDWTVPEGADEEWRRLDREREGYSI
jgi:hypothetical protein